jgi:hypothetical protein
MIMPEKPVQIPEYPDLKRKGALPAYLKYFWRDLVLLLVFLASMWIMQLLNHPIGTVRSLEIPFDSKIPLWPWTALIYNSWAPLIAGLAFYYLLRDRALYRRYLITMILGQLMADATFPFFQTRVPVPYEKVYGATDFFSKVLAMTYRADNNYCGFPSIHVILCTLTIIFIWKLDAAKPWFKILVSLYFTAVAITTVTTKQHVVLDIPGGIVYALVAVPLALPLSRWVIRRCYKDPYR